VLGRAREIGLVAAVVGLVLAGCSRGAPAPTVTRIATLEPVNSPGGFVDTLALAPDASLVATGERGGQIRVWATTGDAAPVSLGNYRQAVADLAFSPDGGLLASLGRHRQSSLRLWRAPDHASPAWTEAAALPVGRCLGLRFDASGARLAVLCETEVLMVDVASARDVLRVPNPHREPLTAFDLSADGQRLLVASHDGEMTVLDAVTASPVRGFSVKQSRRPGLPRGLPPPEVWAVVVALSADGSRAATVTIEGTVYVWDVITGKPLYDHADREAGGPPPGSLRFKGDGTLLGPMGDRYGLRQIDVSARAFRALAPGPRAYQAVAITDNASAFAVLSPSSTTGRLSSIVEVWRIAAAPSRR
jgi:WD40 repeat protein